MPPDAPTATPTGELKTLDELSERLNKNLGGRIDAVEAKTSELSEQHAATLEAVQKMAAERQAQAGLPGYDPNASDDPEKQFSVVRALRGHLSGWQGATKQYVEYELCHEYRKHLESSGLLGALQRDGQSSGLGDAGGLLISAQMSPTIHEELLANSVAIEAGVERLDGITGGPLRMAFEKSGHTVYWPGEGVSGTASQMAFGSVELRPHKAITQNVITREQMAQDGGTVLRSVERNMGRHIGLARDQVFFNGDGVGKPTGIKSAPTPAGGTTDFSSIDYAGADQTASDLLIDMQTALEERNAANGFGELFFAGRPLSFAKLRKAKDADGKSLELFERKFGDLKNGVSQNDRLAGLRYMQTTHLSGGADADLFLFPVKAAFMAMWDTIVIERSEHAQGAWESGDLAVRAIALVDSNILRGEHLQRATGWDIT